MMRKKKKKGRVLKKLQQEELDEYNSTNTNTFVPHEHSLIAVDQCECVLVWSLRKTNLWEFRNGAARGLSAGGVAELGNELFELRTTKQYATSRRHVFTRRIDDYRNIATNST